MVLVPPATDAPEGGECDLLRHDELHRLADVESIRTGANDFGLCGCRRERKTCCDDDPLHARLPYRKGGCPEIDLAVEDGVDFGGDVVDRAHAVDTAHQAALFVIGQDRSSLRTIFGKPRAHRLLVVVRTADEVGRSTDVADAVDLG